MAAAYQELKEGAPTAGGGEDTTFLERAVCWVIEARRGEWRDNAEECFRTKKQARLFKLRGSLAPVLRLCNFTYLLLSFLDVPAWCVKANTNAPEPWLCPDDPAIPREWSPPTMSRAGVYVVNSVEVLLLLVFVFRIYLRREIFPTARGGEKFWFRRLQEVLVPLAMVDIAVCAFVWPTGLMDPVFATHSPILHRLLRTPIFLSFTVSIRQTFLRVLRTMPAVFNVLALIVIVCASYAWMGMVFFTFTPAGKHYPSFIDAIKHMYILLTTNNMPGIMIADVDDSVFSMLYVVSFLLIGLFALMNVLLAEVYNSYKVTLQESILDFYSNRRKCVEVAFKYLKAFDGSPESGGQDDAEISTESMRAFFGELWGGKSSHDKNIIKIMDEDDGGRISDVEFALVAEVLADPHLHVLRFGTKGGVESLQKYAALSDWLDTVADVLSVVAFGLVMYTTSQFTDLASTASAAGEDMHASLEVGLVWLGGHHGSTNTTGNAINWALFGISWFYVLELALELPLKGWEKFVTSQPFQNPFDLATVSILIALEVTAVFDSLTNFTIPVMVFRLLTVFRGIRVWRCLHKLPGTRDLVLRIYHAIGAFVRVGTLLFLIFYFCAQMGIAMVGGKVSKDNKILAGSGYDTNGFWPLNFNDFPSGLMLLWAQLVGNNANVWVDAFTQAFGPQAWFFFLAFDILCGMVLLNILVALIIDGMAYPVERDADGALTWPDREEQLRKMFAGDCPELAEQEERLTSMRNAIRDLFVADGAALPSVLTAKNVA